MRRNAAAMPETQWGCVAGADMLQAIKRLQAVLQLMTSEWPCQQLHPALCTALETTACQHNFLGTGMAVVGGCQTKCWLSGGLTSTAWLWGLCRVRVPRSSAPPSAMGKEAPRSSRWGSMST